MKKMLLLIILILIVSSNVIFAEGNCLPSHRKSVLTTSTYEGRSFGGHYHIITESVYCHDCKDVISYKKVSEKFEGHSYTDYHSGTKHYISVFCSKCYYSDTISYNCSGPPCILPYNVMILLTEQ